MSESRAVGVELGRELTDGAALGANDRVGTAEGIKLTEGCALGIELTVGAELRDGGELVVGAGVWPRTGVTAGTGRPRRATTRNTPAIIAVAWSGAGLVQPRP